MHTELDPLTALTWLVEAGADEAIADAPVDRFVARSKLQPAAAERSPARAAAVPVAPPPAPTILRP
ncbi:MAG: hypothetical protein JWM77_553, partial [Rhodospirillales bacterium]|nr:hypothetical protein [Rhodospirillales bacterium]